MFRVMLESNRSQGPSTFLESTRVLQQKGPNHNPLGQNPRKRIFYVDMPSCEQICSASLDTIFTGTFAQFSWGKTDRPNPFFLRSKCLVVERCPMKPGNQLPIFKRLLEVAWRNQSVRACHEIVTQTHFEHCRYCCRCFLGVSHYFVVVESVRWVCV